MPSVSITPTVIAVGSVPEGKVADFLTGNFVKDTPEEYVRQNIEKAVVRQYKYPAMACSPEFTIRVGSSKKRVDIAIFDSEMDRTQANAFILIETKRAEVKPTHKTDGIGQLQSYMAACLNVRYGMWTNGDDRFCFAKRKNAKGGWTFDEIIDIPSFGQTEQDAQRPRRKDLKPATADNLLFAFRRCHNFIAANEGKQKTDAFWELLKLIFTKIEDERSATLSFYATPSERENSSVATAAKKRIQDLFISKVVQKYPTIFAARDMEIDLKPSVIAYVVTQLQGYSLLASPVDVKGVAYEEIVGSNLRGDRGEFFTPRNACRMAVTMINPQPGEKILDPTCGTGGFLITGMNHALDFIEQDEREQWSDPRNGSDLERQELFRRRSEYLSQCVFGIDLNPSLVRAAKMNMVMNNDGSGGLWQANTLENPHRWDPGLRSRVALGSVDVIVSNPPFGTKIPIDDEEILEQYDLAAMWDQGENGDWAMRLNKLDGKVLQKSQPPEILFIERCIQLLKPGTGRMAIVVPNGILNNPGLAYVRQWILRNTQILAVVDMHRDLFQPGNDTQTSMVLMRRLNLDEVNQAQSSGLDYPLFMAVAEKIGHDKRGNLIYRRTPEGEDALVKRIESVREIDQETGDETLKSVEITERQIDDELADVSIAYLRWLSEQQ
ncbi:N-6 DNA methylase [Rhodococcus fascians]|nr:N-6 DNA methylase [Rhodococcus fascians]MBY4140264.1 N-6 DNA methylase [Rhodococcus fascians]MBY4218929.1 N-6 DNA methylase [Rhodococcus fascians]MBY4223807.1 N-6 DNA methylase [Rhodococcus fascians]MBY4234290.1 N-6 DNA methylase [Rhodococcus fascians]